MDWSQAGADFEPHISVACAQPFGFDSFEQCASKLRESFLNADLKLWNAIEGRHVPWEQRPQRLMPAHLVDKFTMGGKVQHLRLYRSDSSVSGVAYGSNAIAALIQRARARVPGTAYPQVDHYLYSCAAPRTRHRVLRSCKCNADAELTIRPCSGRFWESGYDGGRSSRSVWV